MSLLRHTRTATPPRPQATGQAELSRTLVPLAAPMAIARPNHARRCLKHLPDRLDRATPLLDPEHPGELDCTAEQARALVLWLHQLPSHEQRLVGCHPRRPT